MKKLEIVQEANNNGSRSQLLLIKAYIVFYVVTYRP